MLEEHLGLDAIDAQAEIARALVPRFLTWAVAKCELACLDVQEGPGEKCPYFDISLAGQPYQFGLVRQAT